MTGALIYLDACSIWNRIIRRFRRLREPRYVVGVVVGCLYVYFALLRPQLRTAGGLPRPGAFGSFSVWAGSVGALMLWLGVVLRWVLPSSRPALPFSGAEVQFLFTAPVPRRRLVHYKLLAAQVGILFSSLVLMLFGGRLAPSRLSFALGVAVLLSTLRLHLVGVALNRASLAEPAGRRRLGAWLPLGLTAAVSTVTVAGLLFGMAPLVSSAEPGVLAAEFLRQTTTGPVGAALWPARALVVPVVAEWPWGFLAAAWPALLLLALNYAWVLASDARLEDAAAASERRRSEGRTPPPAVAVRRAPFTLASTGRPEIAILWKNVMMLGRQLTVRNAIRVTLILSGVAAGVSLGGGEHSGGFNAAVIVCFTGAILATLTGPQMLRNDLRTDLAQLPILKTWPLRGAAIVRGEVLAPALILSAFAWLSLVLAFLLWLGTSFPMPVLHRLAFVLAAMFAIPGIITAQLVIQNAVAVLFPGWVVIGTARARGIEALGQQMLLFAVTFLVLALGLLPAALGALVIGLPLYWLAGWICAVPAAAIFLAVVLLEAWLATAGLGRVLDRTDPSAVEANE